MKRIQVYFLKREIISPDDLTLSETIVAYVSTFFGHYDWKYANCAIGIGKQTYSCLYEYGICEYEIAKEHMQHVETIELDVKEEEYKNIKERFEECMEKNIKYADVNRVVFSKIYSYLFNDNGMLPSEFIAHLLQLDKRKNISILDLYNMLNK